MKFLVHFDWKLERVPSEYVGACLNCGVQLSHLTGAYQKLTLNAVDSKKSHVQRLGPSMVDDDAQVCTREDAEGEPSSCRISFTRDYVQGLDTWLKELCPYPYR